MSAIIAYGSLMNVAELEPYGIRRSRACPVNVLGFRRSFSQEPSRRKGIGNRRGVLTVSASDQASMSAILISEVSESAFVGLDARERGYDRVKVQLSRIRPFDDHWPEDTADLWIYVGKPHKFNSELEPNADYLKLCVEAAGKWGERFLETFRKTTFIAGTSLAEHAAGAT